MNQKPPRIADLDESSLSPTQKQIWDDIVAGPRGQVAGPLKVWLHSPALAGRAQALGQYARYDSVLPPILSELAILVTARMWSSNYEWSHHVPYGLKAGLPQTVIDALAQAKIPELQDEKQRAVFTYAVELHRDRAVSDATFDRAKACLGDVGVVDLVGICGYYTLISMTINVFHVREEGELTLPQLDIRPHSYFMD